MIEEKDENKLFMLLKSEETITSYMLPLTVFKRTENWTELLNKKIRNIYGTIEEVQL